MRELLHVLHSSGGANVLLDLVVDGASHLATPREMRRDHIHGRLIHVDFLAVTRTETITVTSPVIDFGEAAGVKAGGVVEHHLRDLHVECLPQDVPDGSRPTSPRSPSATRSTSPDLLAPEGVTLLADPRRVRPGGRHPSRARSEEVPIKRRSRARSGRPPRSEGAAPPAETGGEEGGWTSASSPAPFACP